MSNQILNKLGAESKTTLLNLAITSKDLMGSTDFSNAITKDNAVSVDYSNGVSTTTIRISNNVLIFKDDLKKMPLLLEIISQTDMNGESIELKTFPLDTQSKIALCFMQHLGYVRNINNVLYFTENIRTMFNTEWWGNLFDSAQQATINYVENEVKLGNQPSKDKILIEESNYISVDQFKALKPEAGMNILWALSIYFFDKIIRNWEEQTIPEIIETETIMDVDISPGKYVKTLDAKNFFLTQLKIYLSLRPNSIFFGGSYFSRLKEFIQQKALDINKTIILEELTYFTDWMNTLYSGGNNELNGLADSGTEPFTVVDVVYSEEEIGPTTNIVLSIVIKINTYQESAIYTLPISTKIN